MREYIKNIEHGAVLTLGELVNYLPGQIVSKTLAQNAFHSLTLFAFDKGEEISTHESAGDAMITALDGSGKITIGSTEHILHAGQSIIMPAKAPHAVYAAEQFKMQLLVLFPESEETT